MPREFSRVERIGEQIQRELAELLTREVNDPRFVAVTITGVEVTRDLAHARVYVTMHSDSDVDGTVRALHKAAGFLRRNLGRRLHLRTLPRLEFVYDPTLDRADRVAALLEQAKAREPGQGSDSGGE